jgi:hypothetical protein
MSAIRKLAAEAADNGLLAPELAQGISRVKSVKSTGIRRVRMLEVYNLCAYRRRTEPECFLPDPAAFPPYHQRAKPYIFSTAEVARLLKAAASLTPRLLIMAAPPQTTANPLNPEYTAPNRNEKEAARYLGLSVEGLRTLRKQGRGPASYKIGRCVRFSLADLVAFAESHRRPA